MTPRTTTNRLPLYFTMVAMVIVYLAVPVADAFASQPTPRIFLRRNFSTNHRDHLIAKLRKITGLAQLRFESDGSLSIGSESGQGSQIARTLLANALNGPDVIVFEDASSRSDVVFCRVVPGRQILSDKSKIDTHVVLIDFTDFEKVVGDKQARESFDVGWGVLHELDHVVSDTVDGSVEDHLGECEKHINEMRGELGLPLRAEYFYRQTPLKTNPNFRTNFVSLSFEQRNTVTGKLKTFLLTWDSSVVGGLLGNSATASLLRD
jgi:hypothetical protein